MIIRETPRNFADFYGYTQMKSEHSENIEKIQQLAHKIAFQEETQLSAKDKENLFISYNPYLMLFQHRDNSHQLLGDKNKGAQVVENYYNSVNQDIILSRLTFFEKVYRLANILLGENNDSSFEITPFIINIYKIYFKTLISKIQKEETDSIKMSTILISLHTLAHYHIWKARAPLPSNADNEKMNKALISNYEKDLNIRTQAGIFIQNYQNLYKFLLEFHSSDLEYAEKFKQKFSEFFHSAGEFGELVLKGSQKMFKEMHPVEFKQSNFFLKSFENSKNSEIGRYKNGGFDLSLLGEALALDVNCEKSVSTSHELAQSSTRTEFISVDESQEKDDDNNNNITINRLPIFNLSPRLLDPDNNGFN